MPGITSYGQKPSWGEFVLPSKVQCKSSKKVGPQGRQRLQSLRKASEPKKIRDPKKNVNKANQDLSRLVDNLWFSTFSVWTEGFGYFGLQIQILQAKLYTFNSCGDFCAPTVCVWASALVPLVFRQQNDEESTQMVTMKQNKGAPPLADYPSSSWLLGL